MLKRKLRREKIVGAIICSVVPYITLRLKNDLQTILKIKPYIVGKDIVVPIRNLYHKPKEVGQDRLVNAFAAITLYKAPIIAIDFGTAITFDVISRYGEYLGGMILPGLKISLEALNQRTALLPDIKLSKPRTFIGRDTKTSMLSGIIYGFSSLSDELIMRIRNKIGRKAKVIATGGNSRLIAGYCKKIDKLDLELTLKGLNLLFLKKNT
jgi:type III pantothenate kinase